MTISARNAAATLVPVIGIAIRNAANVLTTVVGGASRGEDGVTRDWYGMLSSVPPGSPGAPPAGSVGSISVTPNSVQGFISSQVATTIETDAATVTLVGASNPTYLWSRVSGDATWVITAPNSATTAFRRPSVPSGAAIIATFRCLVTDVGQSADSEIVTATVDNYGTV